MKLWRVFLLLCLLLWCTTGLFARTAPHKHWGSATYAAMGNMFDSAASSMVSPWNPLTAVRYFNGGADADPSYMRNYELGSSAYQMGHQLGYAGAELGSQVGLAYGVGGLVRVSGVAARGGAAIGGLSYTERSVGALQWESNQSQIRSRVLANIQANRAATLDIANGLRTMEARAAAKTVTELPDPYQGVKQASQYLQSMGVPRADRVKYLQSFDVSTISVETAGNSTFGFRFHDFGQTARPMGQFLSDTFTPLTGRANMALPPQWNGMTGIAQWQIKPGTTFLSGQVGPQLQFGSQYVGGARQMFVLEPWKYRTLLAP